MEKSGRSLDIWNEGTLFPLGEAYKLGREMAAEIKEKMEGGMPGSPADHGVLAQMIHNAGHGNHIALGTRFGGTAILAGLVKAHYGLKGKMVCVIPITGNDYRLEPAGHLAEAEGRFFRNVDRLGLGHRMELMLGAPQSVPFEMGYQFVSGSIPGRNDFQTVMRDWNRLKGCTQKFVMIKGNQRGNSSVGEVLRIANEDREWRCVLLFGVSALFERVM